jgi:hypothetical protein
MIVTVTRDEALFRLRRTPAGRRNPGQLKHCDSGQSEVIWKPAKLETCQQIATNYLSHVLGGC